jgi:hypothetical protein
MGALTGKFLADFSSFTNAVAKAEVQLKGFEGDANKVATSLDNMANRLKGNRLVQDAQVMAEAVDRIGGISKLTDKELQRLSAQAQEAAEKLRRMGEGVPANLQKIADAAKSTESPLQAMGTSFTTLVASFLTAQAIIGGVKEAWHTFTGFVMDSVKAAGEAEKAHVQMVAALKSQGTAIPSVVAAFGDYAKELQRTTIYQDDALEASEALLVQVGNVMPRDMEKALQATTNLASGLGKDLTDATLLVAKAAEGNVGALKKAGIVIDETKAKQEGFGYVLDQITAKFGGQAAAVAGTYQGRIAQLGNTWNDVQESVGRVITTNETLLSLFGYVNTAIGANTTELNQNKTATNLVSDAVITSVRGFALFIDTIDKINLVRAGFVITAKTIAGAFEGIAFAGAYAAKGIALATNNLALGMRADKDIADLGAAMTRMHASIDNTVQGTITFGNALADIRLKAEALAQHLQTTRGNVVTLATATDTGTHAWDRNTQALEKNGAAAKSTGLWWFNFRKEIDLTALEIPPMLEVFESGFGASDDALLSVGQHIGLMTATTLPNFGVSLYDVGRKGVKSFGDIRTAGQQLRDGLEADLKSIPQTLVGALTGGGGLKGAVTAIGSQVGSTLGESVGKSISSAATGIGSLAGPIGSAIGSLVGPLIGKLMSIGGPSKAEVEGRKTEAQFEQQFKSFKDMVDSVGRAYVATGKTAEQAQRDVAALLAAERQGPEAAQRWIDTLQGAIDTAGTVASEASSRFGPSKTDLQAMAKDAADVYTYMRQQGTFSAEQIAAAFKASQEAQAAALGITTVANDKNLAAMQKGLDDLIGRRDTLWQQVSQEAPEAIMGVIETADRAQLDVMDRQIAAQKTSIEQQAADAAAALKAALENITPDPIRVPYTWVPTNDFPRPPGSEATAPIPMASGGSGTAWTPTLFLAGERGPEPYAFGNAARPGRATRSSGGDDQTQQAILDALARLPRAISRAVKDGLVGVNG